MRCSLFAFLFATLVLSAVARDWTNINGVTIQADLVEVKGEVVVLRIADGTTHNVPMALLSAADQAFARESQTDAAKSPAAEPRPSIFKEMLEGKLVALDGKRVAKYKMTQEPQYYAFYFSAHWCPPCRAFTPKLVEFYNAQEGRKKNFEIIFVSSDNDERSMEAYIKGDSMPWPAIAYRSVDRMKEIKKYSGRGIPRLVLVDREGKVISDSYEGDTYTGPTKVMNEIPAKTAK
jgi:nucleoredoxin